jgi:hypothetical protein
MRRAGILLALGLLLLSSAALAQGGYTLVRWTVDGGGGTSGGGGYTLGTTIGQPDPGWLAEGGYTLAGGFWGGGAATPPEYVIYLPLVMRSY